jgi:chemotaxis protein methyltransferase CheR
LENLTVNETSFFRNRPQLDLLQKSVLEEILRRKQERRDYTLRVWSAGCSAGQEPYTVAILICDALAYYYLRNPLPFEMPSPKPLIPPPWKVEIVASDISYASLRVGQEGIYTEQQMEPVDYTCRLRYFEKAGDKYAVKPQLKELVQFDFHNLKTEFLPRRNDIILCRNVMIYFDEAEQKRLIEKFWHCLNPAGYLFVGHAENFAWSMSTTGPPISGTRSIREPSSRRSRQRVACPLFRERQRTAAISQRSGPRTRGAPRG